MKKALILGILVLLIGVSGVVYAIQDERQLPGYGTIGANYVEVSARVYDGWNLVHGFPNSDWLIFPASGPILVESGVKAIYGFNPSTQEYIRFYPDPEDEIAETDFSMTYLIQSSAFFVLIESSKDDGWGGSGETPYFDMRYFTIEPRDLNQRQLFQGWNFVGITPEMIGDGGEPDLEDMAGSCNIEKAYFFNPEAQTWGLFPLDEDISDDATYSGLAIKVSEDCVMEVPGENVDGPPQLP